MQRLLSTYDVIDSEGVPPACWSGKVKLVAEELVVVVRWLVAYKVSS